MVALASATFMLVSTQFLFFQDYVKGNPIAVDTSRIAASVVTGVGFLGAGAILRTGIGVQGLTTAASLWLVAALGLAAGGGMFFLATIATVLALMGLVALRRVEGKQWRMVQRHLVIVLDDSVNHKSRKLARLPVGADADPAAAARSGNGNGNGDDDNPPDPLTSRQEVLHLIRKFGATSIAEVDYDRHLKENRARLHLVVRVSDEQAFERFLADLESVRGVLRIKVLTQG